MTYEAVTTTLCELNPIGALQELCTANRWVCPIYSFQQLIISNNDKLYTGSRRATISFKVICQMYNSQSTGMYFIITMRQWHR